MPEDAPLAARSLASRPTDSETVRGNYEQIAERGKGPVQTLTARRFHYGMDGTDGML